MGNSKNWFEDPEDLVVGELYLMFLFTIRWVCLKNRGP